jgi:hypothetical protein
MAAVCAEAEIGGKVRMKTIHVQVTPEKGQVACIQYVHSL